jgi:hypothetical protein
MMLGGLCAVVAVTIAGCGTTTVRAGAVSADAHEAQQLSDEILSAIAGTADQREAGHYLTWRALNDPIVACMKEAGYDVRPMYVRHNVGDSTSGTAASSWLGEPGLRLVSGLAAKGVDSDRLLQSADEPINPNPQADTEGYNDARNDCDDAGDGTGSAESRSEPAGFNRLSGEFIGVVSQLDHSLGSPDEYASCMKDHGHDLGQSDEAGYSAMTMWLLQQVPPAQQIPLGEEKPSQAWKDFLRLEGDVLAADQECRLDTYNEAMPELGDRLRDFQSEHAAAITDLQTAWQERVADAERLGWTPVRGT